MKKFNPLEFVLRILQGALVACGAILPGVSGGVLCASFGIYEPLMDFLSNPFRGFKKHFFFLLPVGIGVIIGIPTVAQLLTLLLESFPMVALALFAGLICGTVPGLAKNAVEKEPQRGWMAFILALFPTFFLFILVSQTSAGISPNFGWYIFSGVIWGLSMVVPGLSSSSILIFMGLYDPMLKGISPSSFQFVDVVLPLAIGFVITILASAKPINYLIKHQYPIFSKLILGFVISSVSVITVTEFFMKDEVFPKQFGWDIPIAILCFAAGFAVAIWMDYMEKKKLPDDGEEVAVEPTVADAPATEEAKAIITDENAPADENTVANTEQKSES